MYDISFFDEEIALIKDDDLRATVQEILTEVTGWFWTEPASISGKHHPPDDLVEGGTCRLYLWDYVDKNISFLDSDTLDKWTKVLSCVAHHMGKYEKDASPPTEIRPMLLHLADVAASFRLLVGLPFYTDDLPKISDLMQSEKKGEKFVQRDGIWFVNFGKHDGTAIMELMKENPGYFDWMLKADFEEDVCKQVRGFQAEYKVMLKRKIQFETGNLPLG